MSHGRDGGGDGVSQGICAPVKHTKVFVPFQKYYTASSLGP